MKLFKNYEPLYFVHNFMILFSGSPPHVCVLNFIRQEEKQFLYYKGALLPNKKYYNDEYAKKILLSIYQHLILLHMRSGTITSRKF